VGKPPAAVRLPDGEWTFHRHELLGAEMTESLLRRLRFPNALVTTVRHLVAQHMFHYTADWSDAAVRRFVARVGEPHLRDVLALRRADQIGTCGRREVSVPLLELERRIEDLRKHSAAFTIRDLAVDGRALMRELSISPGPVVGTLLGELLEAVLDDPGLNTQETLLGIARRFYAARIRPDLH
jgi:poly(A) polymerase/tRNA nucleotidyltransferase (CCA-adding enzyme)